MSSPTNCLTCRNWARTDDKLVGLCVVHQGYRFQLEDCAAYAFGESRERSGFTELPKAKAVVSVDVKRELTDAEIEELGAQEAEKRDKK